MIIIKNEEKLRAVILDEWSGLADFLANMIAKYAGELDLDSLPDPDQYYKIKRLREMYFSYMRLSTQKRRENKKHVLNSS